MKFSSYKVYKAIFLLIAMPALPALAQFEISPDHFENETQTATGSFQGSCTLLHEVNYAGLTLPPGNYSLTIRSHGSWDLVTLVRNGGDSRIQARVQPLSGAGPPTALVLERTGQQYRLTGLSLQQGKMLDLHGAQNRQISAESELVPIF
jgi:hypothetical protein